MHTAANSLPAAAPALIAVLAFDAGNRLAVRRAGTRLELAFVGPGTDVAMQRLETHFNDHTPPVEFLTTESARSKYGGLFVFSKLHLAHGTPAHKNM